MTLNSDLPHFTSRRSRFSFQNTGHRRLFAAELLSTRNSRSPQSIATCLPPPSQTTFSLNNVSLLSPKIDMKTAKMPPAEPSSSSRRQPVRQTRTNPPRANSGPSRLPGRNSLAGANAPEQPIDIFPGVTHFADAITALPKELVRHFTLLKEVDAKVFAPEEALFELVDAALDTPPPPEPPRSLNNDASSSLAPASAPMSVQNSSNGIVTNGHAPQQHHLADGSNAARVFDQSNLPRRQLFRQTALKIQEMLVSLEEKNHVISTANDALQKQLARIDDIWPHLEGEFSEEAKWGSDSHWAYPENRAARALNTQAEKTRQQGAANLSAAALVIAEEAAARSDARKQAVAAKKSQKNQQHQDSEHDDHDGKAKEAPAKKANTKRKTAAANAASDSPASVGLGITGQTGAGSTPAPKRRKVEKPTNGGTPTERATNTVISNAKESKAKPSASPRATPAPDQPAPKKRKALPNSNGHGKKRFVITRLVLVYAPQLPTNTLLSQTWSRRLALRCLLACREHISRQHESTSGLPCALRVRPSSVREGPPELNRVERGQYTATTAVCGFEQAQWRWRACSARDPSE